MSASASAEFLADIVLCPFESVKVRMQTTMPPPYKGTLDGISKITAAEGFGGLYKGLYPLWGRQIPYTMMKVGSPLHFLTRQNPRGLVLRLLKPYERGGEAETKKKKKRKKKER